MGGKVLITGANAGLGLSLTELCLRDGFTVYSCLHNEAGQSIFGLKEAYMDRLFPVNMDVSQDESVEMAYKALSTLTDSLDILINNAGIHPEASYNALEDFDFDTALNVLNVNSLGPLRVTKAFLPLLEKGSRRVIVNISSEAGSISDCSRDREYDYCMSKAALNMQSVLLQRYLKHKSIKILSIHPGWMRTAMGGPDADISSWEAALGIMDVIEMQRDNLDGPIYMDYRGKSLNW